MRLAVDVGACVFASMFLRFPKQLCVAKGEVR